MQALPDRRRGPYVLQAAIAAVHGDALTAASTDWPQIVELYGLLLRIDASPVVELNRAVAVSMRDGPAAGLTLIDALAARGELNHYHWLHAARAAMLRRLGRHDEAVAAYRLALEHAAQAPEQRFLRARLDELARRGYSPR